MSRSNQVTKHQHHTPGGLERIGPLLAQAHPDLVISKRRIRKVESIECVRLKRERARQNLGFSSRPFVRPAVKGRLWAACSMSAGTAGSCCRSPDIQATVCRGGKIGWSQFPLRRSRSDSSRPRITFDSAAQMLDTFAMQQGGSQYRGWSGHSNASSGRRSSSAPTCNANVQQLFTAPVLIS